MRTNRRTQRPAAVAAMLAGTFIPLSISGCSDQGATWLAGGLRLRVDAAGRIVEMVDEGSGRDHLASSVESSLLSLQMAGSLHPPDSFSWSAQNETAVLNYPGDVTARIRVTPKPTHLVLELASVEPRDQVELVVWGPYATTISDTIGETVGVVRDSTFGIGIQALNIKTLGGFPWRDNDFPPQIDLFESGDFSDLSEEAKRHVLYRVEAAKPEEFGSTLQAYCRSRDTARVIENWNHDRYVAPAFHDGGVVGSRIALFGSPNEKILETLGVIELEEGLPHPKIDGVWGKTARSASSAYLILDFGEDDIDQALAWTKKAGLRYLYHPEPFRNWGHFELRDDRFPNGREGLQRCVEKAAEHGVYLGAHTLSNFITTNDPYVTPVPDPRLARVGTSQLLQDIDETQTEIPVASPDLFVQFRNNNLRTVTVGEELIQYRMVSEQPPWRLLDCQRGAFGTQAAAHDAGDDVALLADHGYRVFLTDAELTREVASNIADLFNHTGLRQISFDGVEGNQSTGMGNYGEILFTTTWYERLTDDIRNHYIADASRTTHFFWHIYTRMNWGEPWYAGFRESQTEYRLKNQPYFRRNFMPAMLGWFRMTPQTTIEDVEWMLARSAAFDAGYAFVTSYETLTRNGFTDSILATIGIWERARMADAFGSEQKHRMEDVQLEFHLAAAGPDEWRLIQVYPQILRHAYSVRRPGEPTSSTLQFDNPGSEQALHWIVSAEGGTVSRIGISIDDQATVVLAATLRQGWSIRYEGGTTATVRDAEHRELGRIPIDRAAFYIAAGRHTARLDAILQPEQEAQARLELRPRGPAESVTAVSAAERSEPTAAGHQDAAIGPSP
ncbi:MAG: hypothetical protein JSW71_11770 [Gemmatimonadota bacterium]|nr:MAG: hypothetical protein JSW71_11770 [Gemmatimonadota bacterium]